MDLAVQEAEKLFISGHFQRSLTQANRCLAFASKVEQDASVISTENCSSSGEFTSAADYSILTDDSSDNYSFRLKLPLNFPYRRSKALMCIRVDLTKAPGGTDWTERAAAVALQSWYELSKKADTEKEKLQGYQFLEPFLKAYSTKETHSSCCSLELTLVFIDFCYATGHVHESLELAFATIYQIFCCTESSLIINEQRDIVREFLMFLFRSLAYSADSRHVQDGLHRFYEPEWSAVSHQWTILTQINPNSTREVIRFLNDTPIHWPDDCKSALEECRVDLEQLLEEAHVEDDSFDLTRAIVPMIGRREMGYSLPTLGWDGSYEHYFRRIMHLVRVCVMEPLVLSENKWQNRGNAAVIVWSLWIAWRRRRLVSKGYTKALSYLLKPIKEILEAVLPVKRSR